jgi:AcrR family transcriptional regulator
MKNKKTNTSKRGEDRIAEIRAATKELLAIEGHGEFSLRSVAKKVGIRLSTLQYYFPTKKDLLQDTIVNTLNHYKPKIEEILKCTDISEKEKLINTVKIYMSAGYDEIDLGILRTVETLSLHDEDAAELVFGAHRDFCKDIADLVQANNPAVSKNEAENRSIQIVAIIVGSHLLIGFGKPYKRKRAVVSKNIIDTILHITMK